MKSKILTHISKIRIHRLFVIALIVVLGVIDLGTKNFFYDHQGALLHWVKPAFNHGISYSIGLNMALIILTSVVCLLAVVRMYTKHHINSIILILIMAGGGANLIDRLMYGGVRDFIYLGHKIPIFNFIFNVADVYLILGGLLLLYHYNQVDITKQDPESNAHLL